MSLKYYEAASKMRQSNPKSSYYADYAAILELGFDNAPNVAYDEVEYEKTYGENDFETIGRVRVDTVLEYNTGFILGDDYKVFIFPPEFKVQPFYGMKFRWKNNYWLVINTNAYESVANSAEVRRCNNVLRFFDNTGGKVYEPCIMDYTLRFANNKEVPPISVGNGEQKVWCQRNKYTTQIKSNDRFLFGSPEQRVAFRVYAGGTKNYLNGNTMDDNSPTLTEFYVDHYEINPLYDDLVNGFADAYLNEVSIKIDDSITDLKVGEQSQLRATIYKGKNIVSDIPITWTSSDTDVIDIIDNNVMQAKKLGTATITAYATYNDKINSVLSVNVVSEDVPEVLELVVNPTTHYVLQNKSQKFSVFLYKNGIKQSDAIVFTDVSQGVPFTKYQITLDDDNSFTLTNKGMYMASPVLVRCECGDNVEILAINLRGLY